MKLPDAELVPALEPLVDLDRFRDFWAMETLIGHWDGYAEAANNYYLYRDPSSDRFVFLPWGLDQSFMGARPFGARSYFPSVYAGARLTRRLYALPDQRALFRQRLAELNDALWDSRALLEQAERVAALAPDADASAMAEHREYLSGRGDELRQALQEPGPLPEELGGALFEAASCEAASEVGFDFDTAWQSGGSPFPVNLTLDGRASSALYSGSAGPTRTTPVKRRSSSSLPSRVARAWSWCSTCLARIFVPGNMLFTPSRPTGCSAW